MEQPSACFDEQSFSTKQRGWAVRCATKGARPVVGGDLTYLLFVSSVFVTMMVVKSEHVSRVRVWCFIDQSQ